MPISLGLDLGTTTITALAVDVSDGRIAARSTVPNDAEITTADDKARGRSEWDAARIAAIALRALRSLAESLGPRIADVAGLGLTGQQHGVVLLDEQGNARGPFINWQDRRLEEIDERSGKTRLDQIRSLAPAEVRGRTGCAISPGYLAGTLYWLSERRLLPTDLRACFLVDFVSAHLTGTVPVTDATSAASSGAFDVRSGCWDSEVIESLGLPSRLFPAVGTAGQVQGGLQPPIAAETGLPGGLPVCIGMGDNQASFYGSVADLADTVLVNVGTGGQVTCWCERFVAASNLETRPFPGGYLLVKAGLCGGRTYALLERFYREICGAFGHLPEAPLFEVMNRLAAAAPPGADGMKCQPLFTGTRENPDLRGAFTGISAANFSPAQFTRSLLEGMANIFHASYHEITALSGGPRSRLIGAGNGLRQNRLLVQIVSDAFGMPMSLPAHCEEAAFGAALVAAVGLGLLADQRAAAKLIRYASDR